jgi:phytoene dehydrogenase-like protein
MSNQPDAIIIGSGPNGLAAAIHLQQKGLSTEIYEQAHEVGGASRSGEITLPGFVHDLGSAIHPLCMSSPFFKQLPLSEFGLEWIFPEIPYAHPFADGSAIAGYKDVEQTARQLGRDGNSYYRLMTKLVEDWPLLEGFVLNPFQIPRNLPELTSFGLKALLPAKAFSKWYFKEEKTRAYFYGSAAHSTLPLTNLASTSFGLVLGVIGHKYGWPYPRGGARSIPESLLAYYKSIGGKVHLNQNITHMGEMPRAKAYLFDLTPKQLLKIGGTDFTDSYRRRMSAYRYGLGIFKMDFALDGPVPFTNEACRKAGTIHLGFSTQEMEASVNNAFNDLISPRPYVILAQNSIFDSSRAPEGKHTVWAYCHVPNGSTTDMSPYIENQIEKAAPGFKKMILAKATHTTDQMEAFDPNLVGGDVNGGMQDIRQLFTRPIAKISPYNTSNKHIYICSASTPPGGGVHGMCGFNAAEKVLSDHFQ